ncbi:hypothetical protein Ait01nite_070800 [Actinoplanes italicus]|uniref:Amino acid adenylation domain-containing protein n=1 Tax=Actinoplanes italicus TaxID=113567 RepID=A0A2T0JUX4_9ACTN|nr:amino acid adenylation domain-containing protein [Actinoplanes italicus]PRX11438.1 amino acid adenylation domain-containing protein [Actinoplanes italicus]GIE34035.1 hypothetical protein Ait01nite_070800 [Actinoplanes italicus]
MSPLNDCLPDLLTRQADARPDDIAVVHGDDHLTYRQLLRQSTALAGCLQDLGVGPDDCVGLFVEPSPDLMIGAWGVLFAGGAYLPLSPEYPEERLRYMIEDSGTNVIVTMPELADRLVALAPHGTSIVTLADAEGSGPPSTGPAAHDLAYVIYTSGSTGTPKGVMIEHRSIVSQMRWLAGVYRLGPGRTVLQKTPMSFDAAQWEILAPACGARVVMGTPGIYRDAERLIDTIRAYDVTTLQCVPTLLQALLDTERLPECTSLTQLFTGGEALPRPLAQQFLDTMPGSALINLYGPTECTINTSALTVSREIITDGPNAVSIGTPVHATDYLVLDERGNRLGVGEVGELHIGGIQVARGYLHRPDLTAERFVPHPSGDGILFRTGDLAHWNPDGTVAFLGRSDNQVKLRGFRVELDEIKLAIETHDWVRHAAVLVKNDTRTGFQNLIACVELNPKEAALMDQGNHGAHHQSKASKLQVKAQLAAAGLREPHELAGRDTVDLPGREATDRQRRLAFARKTYRFYDGAEPVTRADVQQLLSEKPPAATGPRNPAEIDLADLGEILRWLGPHTSTERLLPKYAYASPGSLYATQLYLQISGVKAVPPGIWYHHPAQHRLVRVAYLPDTAEPTVLLHFAGKRRAIEPVYKNNIREVLEIETGHMVGLLQQILPGYGLDLTEGTFDPDVHARLDIAPEDWYLGTFALTAHTGRRWDDAVDLYVQAHPGRIDGLPAGQYAFDGERLEPVSAELIQRRHVIAINQAVYDRAAFGVSVISRTPHGWRRYIDLGRTLQRLSMNDLNLGFMSSGYSSRSGDDLPSARVVDGILRDAGRATGPSYFFLGGRVSDDQRRHEGMNEDVVHMRGPAEMIRDDLVNFLPDYMIPNKVIVLDALPTTANGKIDVKALSADDTITAGGSDRPFVAPRTGTERRIAELWKKAMKRDTASVQDDFFATGGNSLIAVALINRINREFATDLPLQVLFESPTIEKLAQRVDGDDTTSSRLVPLRADGTGTPVFCWPGLGGYTMNLRPLAGAVTDRPFYGVQAHGINAGEEPYPTIREMAAQDVRAIKQIQPDGPYTLWGYSFGARVAFETAYQLEQLGDKVEHLFLIAPGAPEVRGAAVDRSAGYGNPAFVTILLSVFTGTISGPLVERGLAEVTGDDSLVAFVHRHLPELDTELIRRIIRVTRTTFEFSYTFRELRERRITAPITIFKARGDDYSFLEHSSGYASAAPAVVDLAADHYSLLRADLGELTAAIGRRLDPARIVPEEIMPHINIKFFPVPLSADQQSQLVSAVTSAITDAFGCDENVVSIALEPIDKEAWNDQVYIPEIVNRRHILGKVPNYGSEAN